MAPRDVGASRSSQWLARLTATPSNSNPFQQFSFTLLHPYASPHQRATNRYLYIYIFLSLFFLRGTSSLHVLSHPPLFLSNFVPFLLPLLPSSFLPTVQSLLFRCTFARTILVTLLPFLFFSTCSPNSLLRSFSFSSFVDLARASTLSLSHSTTPQTLAKRVVTWPLGRPIMCRVTSSAGVLTVWERTTSIKVYLRTSGNVRGRDRWSCGLFDLGTMCDAMAGLSILGILGEGLKYRRTTSTNKRAFHALMFL